MFSKIRKFTTKPMRPFGVISPEQIPSSCEKLDGAVHVGSYDDELKAFIAFGGAFYGPFDGFSDAKIWLEYVIRSKKRPLSAGEYHTNEFTGEPVYALNWDNILRFGTDGWREIFDVLINRIQDKIILVDTKDRDLAVDPDVVLYADDPEMVTHVEFGKSGETVLHNGKRVVAFQYPDGGFQMAFL